MSELQDNEPLPTQPAAQAAQSTQPRDSDASNISPLARWAADQAVKDVVELFSAYAGIHRKAENEEPISGKEYRAVEERFNASLGFQGMELMKAIDNSTLVDQAYQYFTEQPMPDLMDDKQVIRYFADRYSEELKNNPELRRLFSTGAIDSAFVQQRIIGNEPENLKVPENVTTEAELVQELLKNNRGLGVADIHIKSDATEFLTRNMQNFQRSGVDTIYVEMNAQHFEKMTQATDAELQEMLDFHSTPEAQAKVREHQSKFYHVKPDEVENVSLEEVKMFIAARKHGIRVTNVDKEGYGRLIELGILGHRIASTNFVWTDNIEADRKRQEEQNGKAGKFIVFGGAAHFESTSLPSGSMLHNGLVDEALGIPTIGFAEMNEKFQIGNNPNGPDFYLPASGQHPEPSTLLTPANINPIKDLQKPTDKWQPPAPGTEHHNKAGGEPPAIEAPKTPSLPNTKKPPKSSGLGVS